MCVFCRGPCAKYDRTHYPPCSPPGNGPDFLTSCTATACHTSENKRRHHFYRLKLHHSEATFIWNVHRLHNSRSLMKPLLCAMKLHHNISRNPKYCFIYFAAGFVVTSNPTAVYIKCSCKTSRPNIHKAVTHSHVQICWLDCLSLFVEKYSSLVTFGTVAGSRQCDAPWVAGWERAPG